MGSAIAKPCYVLVYYPFGRVPVAPYPFVDILTGTPQVSGSTPGFLVS